MDNKYFISIDENNTVVQSRMMVYFQPPTEEEKELDAQYIEVSENAEPYIGMKWYEDRGFVHTVETAIEERNKRLTEEVDPIVGNILRWNDLSESKQNEWKVYRQQLLDVSKQSSFPGNISWPTKPE